MQELLKDLLNFLIGRHRCASGCSDAMQFGASECCIEADMLRHEQRIAICTMLKLRH